MRDNPTQRRRHGRALSALLQLGLLFLTGVSFAQAIDPLPFKDHAQEVRFQALTR